MLKSQTPSQRKNWLNRDYLWRIEQMSNAIELDLTNPPRRTVIVKRRVRGRIIFERENQVRILGRWERE